MRLDFVPFLFVLCGLTTAKLPSYIQVCRRSDPRASECIIHSITALQPLMANGVLQRELQIQSIEPFLIDHLAFGNENSLKVSIRNLVVKGGSNFRIEKLRANMGDLKFDIILSLPRLEVSGKYKFVLKLLTAPVQSDGDLFTIIDNSKARISLKGHLINRNGVEYVQFDPIQIKINRGTTKTLKLSNLFGGNNVLSEIVQSLLLNNSEFLLNDFNPYVEATLSRIFTGAANKLMLTASHDEFFPF